MTAPDNYSVIHDMAEQWLPIPLPELRDCPPTVQATLLHPAVLNAQRRLSQYVAAQAQAHQAPAERGSAGRSGGKKRHR